ncbi:MAG TPA: glycosyltransferase family 1 protein [Pyrinomonadaceae bacterium]|nr:glycosyltransferase family 1 protein [Pyrinomonadaceae bacterium]
MDTRIKPVEKLGSVIGSRKSVEARQFEPKNKPSLLSGDSERFTPARKQPDLVCFSHLRWDFVFQRPQHLLTRCARDRRVFFVEEPIFGNGSMRLEVQARDKRLHVVTPHLPEGLRSEVATTAVMKEMVRRLFAEQEIHEYVFWYYTPMALNFTRHFSPIASIYDCMDELSAFKGAHSRLADFEKELFNRVDLVFTGGQSLYEAKRNQHRDVYAFPSSIDVAHFGKARTLTADPPDQKEIAHPRLGFFGVIDERFDIELLDSVAQKRPDWQFVMIGPVVKIHPDTLPRRANIHYLGAKKYEELPDYLAGWDIALLLFARNESTRFISPTKTPEYLAAGKPVISTSIRDVVRPYGDLKLVQIADQPEEFIKAADQILAAGQNHEWLKRVDDFLANISWDKTWKQMSELINQAIEDNQKVSTTKQAILGKGRAHGATVVA